MTLSTIRLALEAEDTPASRALVQFLDAIIDCPDRARALIDAADAQIQVEQIVAAEQALPPYPAPIDGEVLWTIQCQTRRAAQARGDDAPQCKWRPDVSGFTCSTCKRWEGAETGRGGFLTRCFDADKRSGLE